MSEYLSQQLDGALGGAGDIARAGIADIGDSYQEILMQDASISPPDGLAGVMETVTVDTTEPAPEPVALEAYDPEPPQLDAPDMA